MRNLKKYKNKINMNGSESETNANEADTHETNMGENTASKKKKLTENGKRRLLAWILILIFIPAITAVGSLQWGERRHYIVSLLIILAAMLPFLLIFEKRRPKARELVLISVMTAIAVAGRAAFFMLPQFKPVAAVVIITGASLGCEAGFITGALTMFVSDMFFGQGPWTPWQMFALGIIGFLAGVLFKKEIRTKLQLTALCAYGALSSFFIFGLIADTASFFLASPEISLKGLAAVYAAGAVFNLIHALSTLIFLLILAKPILNKLKRIKAKYGLME